MKQALLLLLLLPGFAKTQEIVLIDRNLKTPVQPVPAQAEQEWVNQWFSIYANDLDSVILIVENLVRLINRRDVPIERLWTAGHTKFVINTQRNGRIYTYAIFVNTHLEDVGTSLNLVKRGSGERQAIQRLLQFLDYLKNNRHLLVKTLLSATLLQSPHLASTLLH
jgi:hypothetical protein